MLPTINLQKCMDYIAEARNFHPGYMLPTLRDQRMAGSTGLMIDGVVRWHAARRA